MTVLYTKETPFRKGFISSSSSSIPSVSSSSVSSSFFPSSCSYISASPCSNATSITRDQDGNIPIGHSAWKRLNGNFSSNTIKDSFIRLATIECVSYDYRGTETDKQTHRQRQRDRLKKRERLEKKNKMENQDEEKEVEKEMQWTIVEKRTQSLPSLEFIYWWKTIYFLIADRLERKGRQ